MAKAALKAPMGRQIGKLREKAEGSIGGTLAERMVKEAPGMGFAFTLAQSTEYLARYAAKQAKGTPTSPTSERSESESLPSPSVNNGSALPVLSQLVGLLGREGVKRLIDSL